MNKALLQDGCLFAHFVTGKVSPGKKEYKTECPEPKVIPTILKPQNSLLNTHYAPISFGELFQCRSSLKKSYWGLLYIYFLYLQEVL